MIILKYIVDGFHFVFLFLPLLLFLVSDKVLRHKVVKRLFALLLLSYWILTFTWVVNDKNCVITQVSHEFSGRDDDEYMSFSDEYLKWLYEPFTRLFKYNKLDKVIHIHWMINNVIMFYHLFYRMYNLID